MTFQDILEKIIKKNNSLLCVGLDPREDKFTDKLKNNSDPIFTFNKTIIDQTHAHVCAYKPQIAFYSALGPEGLSALRKTIDYIHDTYPQIPVILDAKRGDVPSTAIQYAKEVFDVFRADAVTVNPYLGKDSLVPFLERKNKGIIVLCRTSNPGATDFQDKKIDGQPLYLYIAKQIAQWNRTYQNCLMAIGATWPEQLQRIRKIAPDMFFLIPGIGIQGGDLEKTLQNGLSAKKSGLIISSSRAIIYASSPGEEAKLLKEKINQHR